MLKKSLSLIFFSCLLLALNMESVLGQHCPPIVESYLSGISMKRGKGKITIALEYAKTGGQAKTSYQAYLMAYKASDERKLFESTPQEAIANGLVSVLNTQVMKRNDAGQYSFEWNLEQEEFVKTMLKDGRVDASRTSDVGGWKSFDDKLRLAIFVPFLEDEKFSVADGLPVDRHECNYLNEAGLLFEQLPQTLSIHFGVVQAVRLAEGEHHVEINGRRPAKSKSEDAR